MTAYSANLAESATSSDVATVRATARFRYVEVAASRRNPALPPNLVINPGFESPVPTQPWVNTGSASMWSVTTADKASGDHSVLLAPTLAGFYGVQQFVYVEPGKTYTFSASLNRVRGSAQLSAYLFWVDRNLATISNVLYPVIPNQGAGAGTANVPIGTWTRYAWTTLPAPPGAVALQLSFAYPAAPAGSTDAVYIDEVQMEAGQLTAFETMGAYDTLTYTYKGAHSSQTALVEGVPSFDTLTTRVVSGSRTLAQATTASDTVTQKKLTGSPRSIAETVTASDAVSTHGLGSSRALSESVPLIGSTLARSLLGARALVETLSTDDGLAIQLAAARALSESGTVSDAVVAQLLADHRLKVWDGTAWVVRPVLWWDGSDWATKRLWRHNGSRWVLVQDRS